ncbi:MAG TPA: MMPL family transporter [Opitutaceae bacterium]|nr:MMPL family transporter [Opitutaceae bacterium]
MNARRRTIARVALAASAVAALAWLAQLDRGSRISTDVLDLVPETAASPELALVRQLAAQAEARTMWIHLRRPDGAPVPPENAAEFAAALRASPAFSAAQSLDEAGGLDAAGRALFAHRLELLFPGWLAAHRAAAPAGGDLPVHLAENAAAELERFLVTPEAVGWQDLVDQDPLLLVPRAVQAATSAGFERPREPGLVWARLAASPLRPEGQGPAFAAIAAAGARLREACPGAAVVYTGVNRFAAASRARIQREVTWINALSGVAVLAVALAFVRQPRRGLHLVPVMALSILGAWAVTTLVFDRVHVIVFVVGSLLTGVAIDYGFYLFMQPPLTPGEPYEAKVRRLMKPLLASCFTTVAGFALLGLSDLPMIRHLGVFVGAGLLTALGGALLYFSALSDPFLPAREWSLPRPPRGRRRAAGWMAVALWLGLVAGLARIGWRDDIRDLEIAAPQLKAEDAAIRSLAQAGGARVPHLAFGSSLAEARERLAAFERLAPGPVASLSRFVPTSAEHGAALRFAREHPGFPDALRAALARRDFAPAAFAGFFQAWDRFAQAPADYDRAVGALLDELPGPASLLAHRGRPQSWFVAAVPAGTAPAALPEGVVSVNQLESLNRVFAAYRRSALRLSLAGLGLVGLGVFAMYGLRDGARVFAIPCAACAGVFGLLGWLGQPLNLFHLFGAFLGVCLTHNYSIFTATSALRGEGPPVSVRLSALTTAASFAALTASGIPVVRALGVTVLGMVLLALAMIELEHLSPLRRTP